MKIDPPPKAPHRPPPLRLVSLSTFQLPLPAGDTEARNWRCDVALEAYSKRPSDPPPHPLDPLPTPPGGKGTPLPLSGGFVLAIAQPSGGGSPQSPSRPIS